MLRMIIYRLLNLPVPTWGVWVRGIGWVKGTRGAYAIHDKRQARALARQVGGTVRYIDDSLFDMEQALREVEAQRSK